MQLHMILKFGSFVVVLNLLKIILNLFVQMFDVLFTINQNCHHTFPVGSHKSTVSVTGLFQTCNTVKLYMSFVDTFAVTTNHLVG